MNHPTRSLAPFIDLNRLECRSLVDNAGDEKWIEPLGGWLDGVRIGRFQNVVYLPEYGIPIIDGVCPEECVGYPAHLDLRLARDAGNSHLPPIRVLNVESMDRQDEQVCILGNAFSHVFGHWLEELFKVVVLENGGYSGKYVVPSWYSDYYFESMDMLEIPANRVIKIDAPTIFREGVVTSRLILFNINQHPGIPSRLREQLVGATAGRAGGAERLWAMRGSAANGRRLINEDEVHECAMRYGFELVDYAALSFRDQIALDRDARILAGPHGSALLHSAFLADRSEVIELFSPFYVNPSLAFCLAFRHRHTQIVGLNSPRFPYEHGQDIYVNRLQLELALDILR